MSPLTHSVKITSPVLLSSLSRRPLRYAVLGAGFAGLSVAWHLLKESPKDLHLHIDLYDEMGIGGGASGVSGGLLHPYSPKVKLLWRGAECWKECLKLLSIAEQAVSSEEDLVSESGEFDQDFGGFLVRRRGILRPATNLKTLNVLNDNAQNCLASCKIDIIDKNAAQKLVPHIHLPFNLAFYMPEAVNLNSQYYLKALFLACQNLVKELSALGSGKKNLCLQKKSVCELRELEGEYDAVIICLGAKADLLPELAGRLPLRTCRGVILHLQLPDNIGEDYPDHGPSILSDAWIAIKGNRSLHLGSTWEWKSRNSSPNVSTDEASNAFQELLPKALAIYPGIMSWSFAGARAGLRAMPPLTSHGSLPLLGCVNDTLGNDLKCKYWLLGGLGSRGLLYHGWLGKLTAEAVLSCNEQIIPSELTSWKNKT
ncbi:WD repeat-containing protein 76-like [Hibiscus syriacus]|uniref:WD repeat-containing protein 76-like n=1 Tax=Hibiscus syriacus TaxID=106335 RepID=A0A6A2XSV9_HIBSY|nr:uncharacterized protein LOC120162414 isoform X2 [Hibiscus syriacus]KAE8678703.1 WD repeat-containing protein 76-like [Hibiscus syriacus]